MRRHIDIILIDDPSISTQPYLDLAFVRAVMNRDGFNTDVHFIRPCEVEQTYELIFHDREPDIVLGTFAYPEVNYMMKALEAIKVTCKKAYICVAASMVDRYYEKMMKDFWFIDLAIIGEPDETCMELCRCIENNQSIEGCLGVAYRNNENQIISNGLRPYIKDLDSLPFPDRSHQRDFHLEYLVMKKNRGCTGTCTFCKDNAFRNKQSGSYFRMRSPKAVVDEIEMLYNKHQGRQYKFFLGDYCFIDGGEEGIKSAEEFFDEVIKRNLKIVMHFQTRAELVDERIIPLLRKAKKAGVASILIGLESANNEELKIYGKKARVDDNERAIQIIKNEGITLFPSFITYNFFSTYETVKKNYEFFYKHGFASNFTWFRTYLELHPETAMVDILVQKGLLDKDYNYLNIRNEVRWIDNDMKTLVECLKCVKIDPRMNRNDVRISRMKNVVKHRLAEEHQKVFKPMFDRHDEITQILNEQNYQFACKCLEMINKHEDTELIRKMCEEYDISQYFNEFERLKYQVEVRFERVRKHIDKF